MNKTNWIFLLLANVVFQISSRWSNLRNAADKKKAKLDKALKLQQFYAETTETKVLNKFPYFFMQGKEQIVLPRKLGFVAWLWFMRISSF